MWNCEEDACILCMPTYLSKLRSMCMWCDDTINHCQTRTLLLSAQRHNTNFFPRLLRTSRWYEYMSCTFFVHEPRKVCMYARNPAHNGRVYITNNLSWEYNNNNNCNNAYVHTFKWSFRKMHIALDCKNLKFKKKCLFL